MASSWRSRFRSIRTRIVFGYVVLVAIALLITVVIGAATLAFFIAKSSWDKQRLAERFPDDAAYAARTGRFFPGW